MLANVHLTIQMGKKNLQKPEMLLLEALQSVEVTHKDEGRSGFQMVFQIGRSQPDEGKDYRVLTHEFLKPFSRVRLTIAVDGTVTPLIDGAITNQQFSPSMEPGGSTFTITGEDISLLMDMEEKSVQYPNQDVAAIVTKLIKSYNLTPEVIKPSVQDKPRKNRRIPSQQGTDLQFINSLAQKYGYVFYVTPGPGATENTAYWGPPKRGKQIMQTPLSVNLGSFTNVESINFQYNALAPTMMVGKFYDRNTQKKESINILQTKRIPPLSKFPALKAQQPNVRQKRFRNTGRNSEQAKIEAQAIVDKSVDSVISANGEVDTTRYGDLLQLRGLVSLRGVGYSYDGLYYVKSVTHKIRKGEYKQSFSLTRDGLGTTSETLGGLIS